MSRRFRDLSPGARAGWLLALSLALAGAAWGLVIRPREAQMLPLRAGLVDLEARLRRAEMTAGRLVTLEREVMALEAAWQEAHAVITHEDGTQGILQSLSALAGDGSLAISKFTPRAPVARPRHTELPIELGMEGAYHDLARFFDELSATGHLLTISDLVIRTQTAVARHTISASFVATFVLLPESMGGPPAVRQ